MKQQAVLVDLDGTLFDTVPVNAESYRRALAEVGATVTDAYYAQNCNGSYYQTFLPPLLGAVPQERRAAVMEQVHERKKQLYAQCLGAARKNEPLFAILEAMRPSHALALVTTGNRQNALEILNKFHCQNWFDCIVAQEDVTNNKPDPEGYLLAMRRLGVLPQNTMIFEDSAPGLEAAHRSGAAVFAVQRF